MKMYAVYAGGTTDSGHSYEIDRNDMGMLPKLSETIEGLERIIVEHVYQNKNKIISLDFDSIDGVVLVETVFRRTFSYRAYHIFSSISDI